MCPHVFIATKTRVQWINTNEKRNHMYKCRSVQWSSSLFSISQVEYGRLNRGQVHLHYNNRKLWGTCAHIQFSFALSFRGAVMCLFLDMSTAAMRINGKEALLRVDESSPFSPLFSTNQNRWICSKSIRQRSLVQVVLVLPLGGSVFFALVSCKQIRTLLYFREGNDWFEINIVSDVQNFSLRFSVGSVFRSARLWRIFKLRKMNRYRENEPSQFVSSLTGKNKKSAPNWPIRSKRLPQTRRKTLLHLFQTRVVSGPTTSTLLQTRFSPRECEGILCLSMRRAMLTLRARYRTKQHLLPCSVRLLGYHSCGGSM